jgi:hypothetical protein
MPKVWTVVIFQVIGSHRRACAGAYRYHVGKADRARRLSGESFPRPCGSEWGVNLGGRWRLCGLT